MCSLKIAKAAGMKVVAIATTHTPEELKLADKLIYDYDEISITGINELLKNKS